MNTKDINPRNIIIRMALLLAILAAGQQKATGQQFSVAGFRVLPNDVSAFITPVYDLNDEPCALIKVVAPEEFAFSSPLGIVKRKDEVGEIWIYLPRGSKMITLKHPQWGVIRNYRFEKPLESHVTYEMKLDCPKTTGTHTTDTIIMTRTIVDTVAVSRRKPRQPLAAHALLTLSLHEGGPSYGIMLALMRRHGVFVCAAYNIHSAVSTAYTCDKGGQLSDGTRPYYSGKTRNSSYTVTAGAIHRLWRGLCLFEGLGYGKTQTAWQLAQSEGGGYALNADLSHKGIAGQAGLLFSAGRLSVSASAITIAGKHWQGNIGIGIKIGKL